MKLYEGSVKKETTQHSGQKIKIRLALIYVGVVIGLSAVIFRLVQLQVIQSPELESLAIKQFGQQERTSDFRLPILDRNGEELAASIPSVSVFARPNEIKKKQSTAWVLAKYLGKDFKYWFRRIKSKRSFIWLKRQIDLETSQKLTTKRLPGIYFESESKRVYPNGKLAAHILGFTDIDGKGISGLELSLNQQLLKVATQRQVQRDGRGNPSYIRILEDSQGSPGVRLTIDRQIQHVLEDELQSTMEETKAQGVYGVVLNPHTGEILALGQRPTFDPNHVSKFPLSHRANRLISHRFEPGSTMKVLFAAEAIQEGILKPDSPIDCEGGSIKVGRTTIREADSHHTFDTIPLSEVIRYSSNVGAVKVVQALGSDRVRAAIDKFGLTQETEIPLPGEVTSGPRGDKYWKPVYLSTVGFGQGLSTTPIQLVAAFAPFANGGFWVRPKILNEESPEEKKTLNMRRIISSKTAQAIKEMMVSVTEGKGGTGWPAKVANMQVAGKTGTAQKYIPGKGYKAGKYYSSFVGFLPADKPELLIGVMVDEPESDFYATQVAAPLFRRVAERSLQVLGKLPRQTVASVPAAPGAKSLFEPVTEPELIRLSDDTFTMPNLDGFSVRRATKLLSPVFHRIDISGEGYLTKQHPAAGDPISPKTKIKLWFSPLLTESPSTAKSG